MKPLYPLVLIALVVAWSDDGLAQVLLAGGHLPVCSSMNPSQCNGAPDWSVDALDHQRYRIDETAIIRFALSQENLSESADLQTWLRLLTALRGETDYNRQELTDRLRQATVEVGHDQASRPLLIDGETLYQRLDDAQWWMLLDHLQLPPDQRREQVQLARSRNRHAREVFQHFVAMAASVSDREKPLIAVSTASSRDPYDAVDFYLQVFEQAGAEVIWLPLDAAMRRARAEGACLQLDRFQAEELGSWQRQRVHPERFNEQLGFCLDGDAGIDLMTRIDGLFLNGGDQWLTLHAFRDQDGQATPELAVLLERVADQAMVIGGTSAGAAVQSKAAMISNGSNIAAMLDGAIAAPPPVPGCERSGQCPAGVVSGSLTWHPPGGLGTAAFGIVDTHFSERQRQFRLLRLLLDSNQRFGLGVDETTAVAIWPGMQSGSYRLQVIGQHALWLIDASSAMVHHDDSGEQITIELLRIASGVDFEFNPEQSATPFASPVPTFDTATCSEMSLATSFNQFATEAGTSRDHNQSCHRLDLDASTSLYWQLLPMADDEPATIGPTRFGWQLGKLLSSAEDVD